MHFVRAFCAVSSLALALALPTSASADTAQDYNLFVLKDVKLNSGDTEGRMAAGGNVSLNAYSVGNKESASGTNLVVGGNLNATNGSAKGKTIVGGTASPTVGPAHPFTTDLQPSGTSLPVDFLAESNRLLQLSTQLAGLASNGTVATPWSGGFALNSVAGSLTIFSMTAAQLATSNTFNINLTPGANALINVSGTAASFSNSGLNIIGGTASNVLWNFHEATTLSFASISMLGSVLAPKADYLGGWSQMHGTLIVNSFSDKNGSTEMHNDAPYGGGLLTPPAPPPAVPEPSTWAFMIFGLGVVGAAMRRKAKLAFT